MPRPRSSMVPEEVEMTDDLARRSDRASQATPRAAKASRPSGDYPSRTLLWSLIRCFKATRWLHRAFAEAGHAVYPSPLSIIPYLLAKPCFWLNYRLFLIVYEMQDRRLQASMVRLAELKGTTL